MKMDIVRSRRRTLAVQVKEGKVVIRAPQRATREEIDRFMEKHRSWIEIHLAKSQAQQQTLAASEKLTAEEISHLVERAKEIFPARIAYYAPLVGVDYHRITIRTQRTRWGSCSAKGNLNFNALLLLAPSEVLDAVVVHELCHRKVMNHSPLFYREVLRVYPAYHRWNHWLKENGSVLLGRIER